MNRETQMVNDFVAKVLEHLDLPEHLRQKVQDDLRQHITAKLDTAPLEAVLAEMGDPAMVAAEWAEGLELADLSLVPATQVRKPKVQSRYLAIGGLAIVLLGALAAPALLVKNRLGLQVTQLQTERDKLAHKLDQPPAPKPFISQARAREIAQAINSGLSWIPFFVEKDFDVTFRRVRIHAPLWILEDRDSSGRDQFVYIDANAGQEIMHLQADATLKQLPEAATPEGAVRRYFALTSAGKYEAAWPLLDDVSQNPNGPTPRGAVIAQFYAREGQPGPALNAVTGVTPLEVWRYDGCKCYLQGPVLVDVELADGSQQSLHLNHDSHGNWRLLWSPVDGLK
jgi:hypothetical protein